MSTHNKRSASVKELHHLKRNDITGFTTVRLLASTAILSILLSCTTLAQDSTMSAKIDSLLYYQNKVLEMQKKIYSEVAQYKEPLEGKKYGIEFNPAYLLASISQSYLVLSGGFSFFNIDRGAEIALPLFIQSGKMGDESNNSKLLQLNQDVIYRKFLGLHQDGFYIEGGVRYTHVSQENSYYNYYASGPYWRTWNDTRTSDRIGAMFGIGYRYFSYSGIYWGASIKYGAYFSSDKQSYDGLLFDDGRTIFDVELLKFGIAF
jgi:hypothetical protein